MNTPFIVSKLSDAEFAKLEKALLPVVVPLEQSPTWGAFDNSVEGRTFLGSFSYTDQDGTLIALGSATLYSQKGRDWIWFKHGPLFASVPNTDTVQKMCSTLNRQFSSVKGVRPLFIRLSSPTKSTNLRLPFEHTMYDQTVVVDLTQSEEEMLAGMSQSGRRGIRSSSKTNVTVRQVSTNVTGFFKEYCFPILQETAKRDGFGIHPLSSYTLLLKTLPDIAKLYVSEDSSGVLAWAITTEYSTRAMYYYGGSSGKARETFAAYALHWHIMKEMKSRGNVSYDFMGIAGKNYEGLKNVTQFKIKFSKNIVDIPFTYDLPLRKARYLFLATAIRIKRRLPL